MTFTGCAGTDKVFKAQQTLAAFTSCKYALATGEI